MLLSTPGLVLHTTNFSESSVIVKVFTRALGVRSYIIKGARTSRSRTKMNLLQPLSYLDLVVYNSAKSNINYIKEMRPAEPFPNLTASPLCTSVVFFMDELLYKVLREEEPYPALFDHTVQCLRQMEFSGSVTPSFPIHYLLVTAHHIGISPLDNYSPRTPYFSLEEGQFVAHAATPLLDAQQSQLLHQYLKGAEGSVPLSERREIINLLIKHFQIHLADFKHFNSHEVLHAVLA